MAAPQMMTAAPAAAAPVEEAAAEEEEEAAPEVIQTEFTVKLTGFDAKAKLKIIKQLKTSLELPLNQWFEVGKIHKNFRSLQNLSTNTCIFFLTSFPLSHAKTMAESVPVDLAKDVSKDEAEKMAKIFEELGGTVKID